MSWGTMVEMVGWQMGLGVRVAGDVRGNQEDMLESILVQ